MPNLRSEFKADRIDLLPASRTCNRCGREKEREEMIVQHRSHRSRKFALSEKKLLTKPKARRIFESSVKAEIKKSGDNAINTVITMTNFTPIGFTSNASAYLRTFIKRATGRVATDSQIEAYFNDIHTFNPDGSANIEFGSRETLSGHTEVADFEADDFVYDRD